jgi:hypothetical protein
MADDDRVVAAHNQAFTHRYVVKYPAHDPRAHDPHMHDFLEWKKRRHDAGTYVCDFATQHRGGDTSECDNEHPLEAHHKVVELAMLNEIDFALLEKDFPGISAQSVGAWIDSDENLTLLCVVHHRSAAGVHTASFSDFGSEYYVRDLISKPEAK